MLSIIKILLLIFIIGSILSLPVWPYSHGWNYYPGIVLGIITIVLAIMVLRSI